MSSGGRQSASGITRQRPATVPTTMSGTATAAAGFAAPGAGAARAEPVPAVWLADLEREARQRLDAGHPEVWELLTRQFEACLIHAALDITRGRRIEAAQKLGIGRNTITRKIQELGLEE
jgi:two-component system nitrogen regulation response regulator GlnG